MRSKLLAVAALSLGLFAAPFALAQDSGTTSSTTSGQSDAADYLTAPNIHDFYTDENLKTLKSADEVKNVYGSMNTDDQAKLKAACAANQESRFADLCKTVGTM
jgi:serine/threonine-protein kinase RIO1